MFCELRHIALTIVTTILTTLLPAQNNLLINGDFEKIRQANIDLMVNQPSKTQTITLDDSTVHKIYYPGTDDRQVMSMHWNYIEDSLSKGTFEMFNALYSESGNAQSGNVYSKFTVMHLDYLPDESSVQNIVGRLKTTLLKGQTYKVKFYLKFLRGSHFSKSICIGFTEKKTPYGIGIKKESKEPIYRHNIEPAWCTPEIVIDTNNYKEYEFQYTAEGGENYIYIGNILYEDKSYWQKGNWNKEFKSIQNLQKLKKKERIHIEENLLSVYAIDNIKVVPLIEELIDTSERAMTFDTIHIQSFFFDLDKSETEIDLSRFVEKINSNKSIKSIMVIGHTDSSGGEELNKNLSLERALFIFKNIKGLTNIPVTYSGRSFHETISNTPSENRRVEVFFIKN